MKYADSDSDNHRLSSCVSQCKTEHFIEAHEKYKVNVVLIIEFKLFPQWPLCAVL